MSESARTAPDPSPPDAAARARRRIVVTGADGLIGWHLRAFWHGREDIEVLAVDRQRFADRPALAGALAHADAVVHLAGMNRGDEAEIEATNLALSATLVEAVEQAGVRPRVVFASSTHRDRDTAYGRSKRLAADQFRAAAARGAIGPFVEWVLPNVFGEHGRPFHNSAISTFCHLLAEQQEPSLLRDQELEWLHAQRAAEALDSLLAPSPASDAAEGAERESRLVQVAGTRAKVSAVLDRLRALDADYRSGVVPSTVDAFERDLFNTYRSYRFPDSFPVRPTLHADARGRLFESVKTRSGGQSFLSTTVPGARRGGHYHRRKFERFLVVEGRARIRVRRLLHSHVHCFEVDGQEPAWVDMPTLHTHDLENIGNGPLVTLFWADELFDPDQPDTYYEAVDSGTGESSRGEQP